LWIISSRRKKYSEEVAEEKNYTKWNLYIFSMNCTQWNMSVDMWRFSEDINTARRFNAVARMQPHCPVLYSGKDFNFIASSYVGKLIIFLRNYDDLIFFLCMNHSMYLLYVYNIDLKATDRTCFNVDESGLVYGNLLGLWALKIMSCWNRWSDIV